MLCIWILGSIAIFWFCKKLKKVVLDYRGKLLISNYLEVIEVRLEDITRIAGTTAFVPFIVWFSLRKPSKFGRKIIFFAKLQPSREFFVALPPIVKELQDFVSLSQDA